MSKYIIRLDDACPEMNPIGWKRMEELLDKYKIKPLVGVIPINRDPDFYWDTDPDFWTITVKRWINKGWVIAQHGCHHAIYKVSEGHWSEFAGKSLEMQKNLILKGNNEFKRRNINPVCFFSPCHSYDENTYLACKELACFDVISDGYAFTYYDENGIRFLPNLYDTPHKIFPYGIYTFVFHPNLTTDAQFEHLESFLIKNQNKIISVDEFLNEKRKHRKRSLFDRCLAGSIIALRKIRDLIR